MQLRDKLHCGNMSQNKNRKENLAEILLLLCFVSYCATFYLLKMATFFFFIESTAYIVKICEQRFLSLKLL